MHDARDRNAGIWIEPNDRLYVAAYSSVASLVVMFSGYFRKADGEIIEYAVIVNPTSDRVVTAVNQHFGAGFLLSCVVSLASGNADRGQCYVRAQVQRSAGTPAIKLYDVLGGYVTDDYSPSFPYGKIEGSLDGAGALRSITGTNPAAGAEISETVPTGARWHVLSLVADIATDSGSVQRGVDIIFDDGTNIVTRIPTPYALGANVTINWTFAATGATITAGASNGIAVPIPPLILKAGYRIRTSVALLQAGDNWTAPQLLVEEWIEA